MLQLCRDEVSEYGISGARPLCGRMFAQYRIIFYTIVKREILRRLVKACMCARVVTGFINSPL